MISLLVNNGNDRLRLFPNTRIRLRRVNPMFFLGDILPADFTLPFDLPVEGNAHFLDWQHLPAAARYPVVQDVVLSIDGGNATFRCQMYQLSANRDRYRVNLVVKTNDLQAEASIRDLVDGEINFHSDWPESSSPQDVNSYSSWLAAANVKYCFPAYINDHPEFQKAYVYYQGAFSENVSYSPNDTVLFNDVIYECVLPNGPGGWDEANWRPVHAYVNRYSNGTLQLNPPIAQQKYPIGMMMYLCQVLKDVAAGSGYTARGDLFADAWMRKQIVWNNFIMQWLSGNGIVTSYKNLLPDMNLRLFLQAIRDFYGVRVIIDDQNKVIWFDMMKNLGKTTNYVDWSSKAKRGYEIEFDGVTGFHLSQEFEHDDYPGEVIGKVRHVERSAVHDVDFRDLASTTPPFGPLNKRFIYERLTNAYLFFDDDEGKRDVQGYLFEDAITGVGDLRISPKAATIPMWLDDHAPYASMPDPDTQFLPRVKHLWSDNLQKNPFGLRFLYYHGEDAHEYMPANQYAYATSHGIVPTGGGAFDVIDADMSPQGMFNRYFFYVEKWFREHKALECDLVLDSKDVLFDQRSLIRINGLNYHWRELEFEIGMDTEKVEGMGVFVRG